VILSAVCIYAILALTASISFFIKTSQEVATEGTIYAGEGLTVSRSSINWGEMTPGENRTESLIVTNNQNAAADLYLSTTNWIPANATEYMALSWNYSGVPIPPHEGQAVDLTLTISEDAQGIDAFSFDIIITGAWG